jgi:hypothetical protein
MGAELQIKLGQLGAYEIFEELVIDFIGPLPVDKFSIMYIFNAKCTFSCFSEVILTEATTAVIAAHCLLGVVAHYGCSRYLRSDRGTHYIIEVIPEFLPLFEMQHILTCRTDSS